LYVRVPAVIFVDCHMIVTDIDNQFVTELGVWEHERRIDLLADQRTVEEALASVEPTDDAQCVCVIH